MSKEDYKGIWVFAEQKDGQLNTTTLELLAKAQQLKAHNGERISAVLLGGGVSGLADTLISHGADQVIISEHENLAEYSPRPYQQAMTQLAEKYKPSIILYGATSLGRDLAPRVMVSLQTGLTADAIDVGYDEDGVFYQTTPGYGGKILAHIVILERRPQMVTVRPQMFEPLEEDKSRTGLLICELVTVDKDSRYEVLSTEPKANCGASIDKATRSPDMWPMLTACPIMLRGKFRKVFCGTARTSFSARYSFNQQNIDILNRPLIKRPVEWLLRICSALLCHRVIGGRMSHREFIIPKFGPFAGMRVIGAGSLIAMPFAASMLAEFGAEFIQIERPGVGDTYRHFAPMVEVDGKSVGAAWMQEARNRLSMTLDLNLCDEDAKTVFYGLIKESDVFLESLVWLDKFGISDAELLNVNPRLIIVHISGFGKKEFGGIPELCAQASYDIIGQAFSGYAMYNGYEDRPPLMVKPALNDYVTALFAVFGILGAYISAGKTGQGQVIDVSQFEAQAKLMREAYILPALGLGQIQRTGNKSNSSQPWDVYTTADDRYVAVGAVGKPVFSRFVTAIGADSDKYGYAEVGGTPDAIHSARGREFDAFVTGWCKERTADQIEAIMQQNRIPCSRINEPEECLDHTHFLGRNDFVSYTDQTLDEKVTAFGVFPKLSQTPGAIWRGAPFLGQDTDEILKTILGFDNGKIGRLHAKHIV